MEVRESAIYRCGEIRYKLESWFGSLQRDA
jgi:hypothetical protein